MVIAVYYKGVRYVRYRGAWIKAKKHRDKKKQPAAEEGTLAVGFGSTRSDKAIDDKNNRI